MSTSVPAELIRAGFSRNIVEPSGTGANRVLIVGEAPGSWEDDYGIPFHDKGDSGAVLSRCIRRIGSTRDSFAITNVVPARPPNNWLDGSPWYNDAVEWGRPILEAAIARFAPRCIVALGGVALRTLTGLSGHKLGVSHLAGYVLPSLYGPSVVACYHPSFLRRGKMSLLSVMMRCLRLALTYPDAIVPQPDQPGVGYCLHPTEAQANLFLEGIKYSEWLAYDIETFYSTEEAEAEEHDNKDIRSIQFSLGPDSGVYFPWRDPFIPIAKAILASGVRKAGWNNWRFDDPVLRAHGCTINGEVHDLMWAWHHSQPDLPRSLQFAAAMQGPNITQPTHRWLYPWKNLDAQSPEFYGIVDVDVLQWMLNY